MDTVGGRSESLILTEYDIDQWFSILPNIDIIHPPQDRFAAYARAETIRSVLSKAEGSEGNKDLFVRSHLQIGRASCRERV